MMKASIVFFMALLCQPAVASVQDDAKNRPVTKVINLLKDMISQMEKEAEEDEEVYETMGCWCVTNDKEKTKSIADSEASISDLASAIEGFTASSSKLSTEISMLEKEVAKNTEALDSATAMRKKELAEFNAEEKESIVTITSLKAAVVALSKHHDAFLQTSSHEQTSTVTVQQMQMWTSLQHQLTKSKDFLSMQFTKRQQKKVIAFIQQATGQSSGYEPASGEIFGILKQMKESFETNLANSQKEETQAQKDYEDLKAAKEKEIAAGTDLIDTKTGELATADEKNAESKESLEDTRNVLAADTKFLANLKMQCQNIDQEYEERTKTRQMEIEATSKALAFLSSDEAHDLFTRTFNFIQVKSSVGNKKRTQIAKALKQVEKKFQDPRISQLEVSVRLDAFTKVKKSIQDMVDKLIKEKEDEIKHKDYCIEELNTNEQDTDNKERDKKDTTAKIEDLGMTIDTLAKEIENLKAEIAELGVQLKRASEDREKQNKEFQVTVADQRATQKLLAAALNVLKGFYDKAALVQKSAQHGKQSTGQAPPPGFKKYEKSSASGGVMGMMGGIIDEAKVMEAEAIKAEEDAQSAYEDFVKDTNMSVEEKSKDSVNKSESKAKAESDKVESATDHEAMMGELEQLANENADLHKSCDFTLKNFELRQSARDDEIEALKQALAMFSGASFSAFLQDPH
jgi:hypothetical protein